MRCACAGLFKAWALVGARLYSVPLRVPRRFYVNSVLPPEDPESPAQTLGGLRVTRTLPFGREAFHIYEASCCILLNPACCEARSALSLAMLMMVPGGLIYILVGPKAGKRALPGVLRATAAANLG